MTVPGGEAKLKADGELTYYLTGDEAEVQKGSASKLSTEKPAAESSKTCVYDPSDPKWAEGSECFLYSSSLRGRNALSEPACRNDRYAAAVNDYVPGQVVEMKIESLPIVWNVPAGHSIRVDISSSDFPEFTNHTNTVGHWAEQTSYKVANQVIYIGGDHASSITLPTLSK